MGNRIREKTGRFDRFPFWAVTLVVLMLPALWLKAQDLKSGKGPQADGTPELDSLIESEVSPDSESVSDLEKVIQTEDGKSENPSEKVATQPSADTGSDEAPVLEIEAAPPAVAAAPSSPAAPARSYEAMPARTVSLKTKTDNRKNSIRGIDFKHEADKISKIIITAERGIQFQEIIHPETKQIVYVFENTSTPDRLQRAFDTTEFSSVVSLFTLLQMPGKGEPSTKLIVQLKEAKAPKANSTDSGLTIEFPAPSGSDVPRVIASQESDVLPGEGNIFSKNQAFRGQVIRRLEIKNSDIQDVLRLIARTSGYNIVVGDDVQGKVGTLSIEEIPWDQAFTLVLQSKKLGYVREGNMIRVGTLSSIKQEKEEALAIDQASNKSEPLKTFLIPISYAKASDMVTRAKQFLTDRGSAEADVRTNTVVLKDIEKAASKVQKLIRALDIQPPRVHVSARIVEIRKTMNRRLNTSLGYVRRIAPDGTVSFNDQGTNITGAGGVGLNVVNREWNSILNLAETDGNAKTLANPSVTVVANQTGTVSQGVSFFVVAGNAQGQNAVNEVRQIDANLTLAVTPIVSNDGSLFMTVRLDSQEPTIQGQQSTVNSRRIDTQILLDNGDTAVLGGVFQNTVDVTRTGIPFFMKIPILGYLFGDNSWTDRRNEVYVFLTAKILNPEQAFKRNL